MEIMPFSLEKMPNTEGLEYKLLTRKNEINRVEKYGIRRKYCSDWNRTMKIECNEKIYEWKRMKKM